MLVDSCAHFDFNCVYVCLKQHGKLTKKVEYKDLMREITKSVIKSVENE